MSELKAKHVVDVYDVYSSNPYNEAQVYLKPEADRYINWIKHKRCQAMAHGCEYLCAHYQFREVYKKRDFFRKWMFRWLEIADKFKEAK